MNDSYAFQMRERELAALIELRGRVEARYQAAPANSAIERRAWLDKLNNEAMIMSCESWLNAQRRIAEFGTVYDAPEMP